FHFACCSHSIQSILKAEKEGVCFSEITRLEPCVIYPIMELGPRNGLAFIRIYDVIGMKTKASFGGKSGQGEPIEDEEAAQLGDNPIWWASACSAHYLISIIITILL
ncbi:hypothetical protein STAS_04202, partial [Striga asiatica]